VNCNASGKRHLEKEVERTGKSGREKVMEELS
jgi:hypothetical protein